MTKTFARYEFYMISGRTLKSDWVLLDGNGIASSIGKPGVYQFHVGDLVLDAAKVEGVKYSIKERKV